MDLYIRRFCVHAYDVPPSLQSSIHRPCVQIAAAWFIIQQQTIHTYMSVQSCRKAIDPTCPWEDIGRALKKLLDVRTMPETLLPLCSIGQGSTAVVIGHYGTGTLTAIKQQVFSRGSWEISSHVLGELLALRTLQAYTWSPTLVFQSVSQDMVQIGMEYIPLSMSQMIRFGGTRHRTYSRRIICQLLDAVRALHACNMVHRDIEPDNIRFRSTGDLVLIDYDSCAVLMPHLAKTRHVCTAAYRDPVLFDECVNLTVYDYRTLDAFSVGAVMLFILNGGKHAFTGLSEREIVHCMRTYMTTPRFATFCVRLKLHEANRSVLAGLLALEPTDRMTVTEAADAYQNTE
jgi:serine/threonine protein kinase